MLRNVAGNDNSSACGGDSIEQMMSTAAAERARQPEITAGTRTLAAPPRPVAHDQQSQLGRRGPYRQYTLDDVLNGAPNVPRSTLRRYRSRSPDQGFKVIGRPSMLTPYEEYVLVRWVLDCQQAGIAQPPKQIGIKAAEILASRLHPARFATTSGLPGISWWRSFRTRHPELATRQAARTKQSAISALIEHPDLVSRWVAQVQQLLRESGLENRPDRLLNADEHQLKLAALSARSRVVGAAGSVHMRAPAACYREHVTVLPTVSADGRHIVPDFFIFPSGRADEDMMHGCPAGTAIVADGVLCAVPTQTHVHLPDLRPCAGSGYITDRTFLLYLTHLFKHLPRDSDDDTYILFIDQSVSQSQSDSHSLTLSDHDL